MDNETGLCWDLLTEKVLASKNESVASCRKVSKNPIKAAECVNLTGSRKTPVALIGKLQNIMAQSIQFVCFYF